MSDSPLTAYEVGAPWPGAFLPDDGPHLSLGPHGAELLLFLTRPTSEEIMALRRGTARFAWISGEHGALLAYRFTSDDGSGIPWGDTPYHWRRETPDRQGPPDQPAGTPATPMLAFICLIDLTSRNLVGMRQMTWPPRAADIIRATLTRQATQDGSETAADVWLEGLYARYPGPSGTTKLVRERADLTWTGADPTSVRVTD